MPKHNIDPQEIADREDLDALLTAPSAGDWQVKDWRAEYMLAEGEHDTARFYGWMDGGYGLVAADSPFIIRSNSAENMSAHANRIIERAAALGGRVSPIVRMRRIVTLETPWVTP